MKLNAVLAVILSFAFVPVAHAVYKCKDNNGKTVFSDVKCGPEAKTIANTTSVIDASTVRQDAENIARRERQDRQREEENALRSANSNMRQAPSGSDVNVYRRYPRGRR